MANRYSARLSQLYNSALDHLPFRSHRQNDQQQEGQQRRDTKQRDREREQMQQARRNEQQQSSHQQQQAARQRVRETERDNTRMEKQETPPKTHPRPPPSAPPPDRLAVPGTSGPPMLPPRSPVLSSRRPTDGPPRGASSCSQLPPPTLPPTPTASSRPITTSATSAVVPGTTQTLKTQVATSTNQTLKPQVFSTTTSTLAPALPTTKRKQLQPISTAITTTTSALPSNYRRPSQPIIATTTTTIPVAHQTRAMSIPTTGTTSTSRSALYSSAARVLPNTAPAMAHSHPFSSTSATNGATATQTSGIPLVTVTRAPNTQVAMATIGGDLERGPTMFGRMTRSGSLATIGLSRNVEAEDDEDYTVLDTAGKKNMGFWRGGSRFRNIVIALFIINLLATTGTVAWFTYRLHMDIARVTNMQKRASSANEFTVARIDYTAVAQQPAKRMNLDDRTEECSEGDDKTSPQRLSGWKEDGENTIRHSTISRTSESCLSVTVPGFYVVYDQLTFSCPKKSDWGSSDTVQFSQTIFVMGKGGKEKPDAMTDTLNDFNVTSSYLTSVRIRDPQPPGSDTKNEKLENCYTSRLFAMIVLEVDDVVCIKSKPSCLLQSEDGLSFFGIYRVP